MNPLLTTMAMSSPAKVDVITLSGTDGTPISYAEENEVGGTAKVVYDFQTTGIFLVDKQNFPDINRQTSSNEWCNQNPLNEYWVRATRSGVTSPGSTPNTGLALDTAYKCAGASSADREWGWTQVGNGSLTGKLKFEIATDSGMSNIVATGYYLGTVTVTTT